jgi:hypothetical protein
MTSCKLVDTLIYTSKATILPNSLFSDPIWFFQIIVVLQYLTFTRLEICFAVNIVYQFMHAPIDSHWVFIKRILCYLQRMTSYGLYITRSSSFALHCFTNVDWADSINDRKSIGGYLVFFGQTLISGKSSKQRTVACSSTKIEYKTLADHITGVIWLQNLLIDL